MAYGGNPQTFFTTVGVVREATWAGAAGSNWLFFPASEPRFNPRAFRHILDNGMRGMASEDYDLIPGPGEGQFGWSGAVYLEPFPALLNSIIGADAVSGAAPTVHTFDLDPIPPSMVVQWANDTQGYTIQGGRIQTLTLNFNGNEGFLGYQVQGMGKLGNATAQASLVAASYTTLPPVAGWQGAVTGVTASALEGTLTFTRNLKPMHPLSNTQDLGNLYAGTLKVTGRLTMEFTSSADYDHYLAADKTAVTVKFTRAGSPEESIAITMTKMGWREGSIDQQDNIYTVPISFNGIHNTTDQGPVVVVVKNPRATGYNA